MQNWRAETMRVIWGGKVYTRQERRRLTLAAAKKRIKGMSGKRHLLMPIWHGLMVNFPAGTFDSTAD